MNTVTQSEFSRMTMDEKREIVPAILTADGEDFAMIVQPQDVVVISDLHPRVRNMIKNMELKARAGMPKPIKVFKEE